MALAHLEVAFLWRLKKDIQKDNSGNGSRGGSLVFSQQTLGADPNWLHLC